jgi:hypothetical protein
VLSLPSGGQIGELYGNGVDIRANPAGYIKLVSNSGNNYLKIDNLGAYVFATNNQWAFGTDGKLTLPAGGDIVDSTGASVLGGTGSGGGGTALGDRLTSSTYEVILEGTTGTVSVPNAIISQGSQLGLAGSQSSYNIERYLRVRDGDVPSHIHIVSPNNYAYDLIFGDDSKYLRVDHTGTVVIGTYDAINTNTNTWTFGTDGKLTLSTAGIVRSGTDTAQVGYSYGPYANDIYNNTTGGALSSGYVTAVNVGSSVTDALFNPPTPSATTTNGTISASGVFTPGTSTGTFGFSTFIIVKRP